MIDTALSAMLFSAGERLPHAAVVFAASYLIWVMAALLVIALWRSRTTHRAFALLAASALLAYAINGVIGFFVARERPFVSGDVAHALINTAHLGGSFPSDHAAVAWALAFGYAFGKQKNAWLFFGIAFLVSVGRVVAGVHFVGDVAGGAIVGLASSALIRFCLRSRLTRAAFLR